MKMTFTMNSTSHSNVLSPGTTLQGGKYRYIIEEFLIINPFLYVIESKIRLL